MKPPNDLPLKFIPASHPQEEDDSYEVVGHPTLTIQVCFEGGGFGVTQEHPDGRFSLFPTCPTLESAVKLCAGIVEQDPSS